MKSRFTLVVFILSITTLLISGCQGSDGAFGPIFPTPTQIGVVSRPPVPVNFETLDSDPFVFVDRFIQVTGQYVPPRNIVCSRQRGPSVDWFLVSGELEMNMSGFGSIVGIAQEGSFFTVDGIWRRYEGPVGCTKEPKNETVWYLEVVRIVDPNPLVASTNGTSNITLVPSNNTAVDPQPQTTATVEVESAEPEFENQVPTPLPTATPLTNSGTTPQPITPTPTIFVVSTPTQIQPTATATASSGASASPTATPTAAASTEPTSSGATQTAVPTEDSSGLGGTGSGTPNAATPVPTQNGGYPAPALSPTANPYP